MQGIGSFPLSVGASERIRKEWLPKVADARGHRGARPHRARRRLRPARRDHVHGREGRRTGRQRPQVVHHQRRRRDLLQRPGQARATALAGVRAGRHPRRLDHQPAPDHRPARARRRDPRGRAGAAGPPPRRAGQGLQADALHAGHLPGLGRGRRGRAWPRRRSRRPSRTRRPATSSASRWPSSGRCRRSSREQLDRDRDGAGDDLPGRRGRGAGPAVRAAPLVDGEGRGHRDGRPGRRPVRAGDGPVRPGARVRRSNGCTATPDPCGSTRARPR